MSKFQNILKGGDLRSIGKANDVASSIRSQDEFDELYVELANADRKVVMRTADAIEKITIQNASYLQKHKKGLLNLFRTANNIELKWHLALLVSRLNLSDQEFEKIWDRLTIWAKDKKESKIVRVNSIQGLFNLLKYKPKLLQDFNLILSEIEKEKIPSVNARIRKISKTCC